MKEQPKQTVGVRLDKEDLLAIEMLNNRRGELTSDTMRLVINRGISVLAQERSEDRKVDPIQDEPKKKKDPRLLEAMANLAKNELILMHMFVFLEDRKISVDELINLGYTFGCQASEEEKKVELITGFRKRDIRYLRTCWMFRYGLQESEDNMFRVLERD